MHNCYALREGISYCEIDGSYVFLDARADRYLMLTGTAAGAFRTLIAAEPLPHSAAETLKQSGVIEDAAAWSCPPVPALPPPSRRSEAAFTGSFRVIRTLQAMHAIRRARGKLQSKGIHGVLKELRCRPPVTKIPDRTASARIARTLRAFEHTRLWIPSADQCLPRTIALVMELKNLGYEANLVVGVRIEPFRAHCWAQQADEVLNDSAEEVGKFKPILVL
ncbi:hypothetical protein BV97_01936 [Novosphingobium resinovorum]|uniref:Microcin J25-processing protein McjB C-terminal domain-containing protein n=2 Tax=Novosphingobium resinovorum TaxID=158500 RepID=A0A031JZS4_9SPHN|nr:hypothetical protein BV97_01936 [Novosphingobium resinovorum]